MDKSKLNKRIIKIFIFQLFYTLNRKYFLNYPIQNDFVKYKGVLPKKIEDIYKLRDYVSLKLTSISI